MKTISFTASLLALAMAASSTHAKVTTEEASKLGKELTLVGAQSSANAAGTIPAFTGGLAQDAQSDPYTNIFENEKPLFE